MLANVELQKIELGATSMDVLRLIAWLNMDIKSFEFSRYKPLVNVSEMKTEPDLKTKMTRHYPPQAVTRLVAHQVRNSQEPNFSLDLGPGEILNLHSRVITENGTTLHIPMMDLDCSISDENLKMAGEYARILGREGVVLQTGRSYHYYGFHLLTEKEWWSDCIPQSMLGKVCDIRYMAHKLKDRFITLRLTAGGIRNTEPKVVLVV